MLPPPEQAAGPVPEYSQTAPADTLNATLAPAFWRPVSSSGSCPPEPSFVLDLGRCHAGLMPEQVSGSGCHVVTGEAQNQRHKIRHLGLETCAGCILISEEVGLRKLNAAIFRLAAERLGVPVQQVLFVGDHPDPDVMGAARAGMQTAWLLRNRSWPYHLPAIGPNYQISSLSAVH